jgi:hypothetical protein
MPTRTVTPCADFPVGTRLTTPALPLASLGDDVAGGAREDSVEAWLDKEKLLPGAGLGIGDRQGCARE